MVKRKRVFSASNVEEKTDNGLSFEGQIDGRALNQCKKVNNVGRRGGGNDDDGIEPEASAQARLMITDTSRSTSSSPMKQSGHCELNRHHLSTDVIVVVDGGGGGGGEGKEGAGDVDVGSRRLCTATGLTLRSSIRTQKRTRSPSNNGVTSLTSTTKKREKITSEVETEEKVKTRRAWELWSVHDTDMFFEALCEYGKDFQKIRNFVMRKNSKKVAPPPKNSKKGQPPQMIKNKDQVRHFYYRTWHKISKYLRISDDVNRQTQELYGLINYGELRKKIGGRLDEKNGQKLNEMVHSGATTIRCKGKNIRIRTPLCNALKKLNDVEDLKEEEGNRKLPSRVTVEFRPRNNHSWSRVQNFSQNPRIRIGVNLQRRLTTVIDYLQRRWREPTVTQRNKVLKSLDREKSSPSEGGEPFLRIMPKKDATINTMSLNTAGIAISSSSISLKNYRRKTRCLGDLASSSSTGMPNSSSKRGSKTKGITATDEPKISISTEEKSGDEKKVAENNSDRDSDCVASHELTLRQLLALETAVCDPVSKMDDGLFARTPSFMNCDVEVAEADLEANDDVVDVSTVDKEAVRRGWKASDCGTLTFGEMYLLLDRPDKLILEYEWEYPAVSNTGSKESEIPLKDAAGSSSVTKLTTIMNRLLLIASSTFIELGRTKQERQSSVLGSCCRCGHSCPLSPKSSSSKTSNSVKNNSSLARGATKNQKSNAAAAKVCSSNGTDALSGFSRIIQATTLNETPISIATSSAVADVFRRPILTSVQNKSVFGKEGGSSSSTTSEKAFKEHLHKFLPQQRKSKGRMSKSMVVQRELPLLPKAGPAHSMMTLSFIPSASSELAGSFMPVLTNATLTTGVTTLSQQQHHQQHRPPVTRVVQLAPTSIVPTVGTLTGTSLNELKANVVPFVGSNTTMSLATLPLPRQPTIVSGIHSISAISGSPCAVLIGKGSPQTDTTVTTSSSATVSPITVSSRPSFANRLTSSTTSFPVSTSSSSVSTTNLDNNLRIGSDLKIDTECASSSSSIPVMSISESSIRSNLSISPPTISSLLDISLTGTDTISMVDGVTMGLDASNDKLLDLTLGSSNSFSGLIDLTIVGSVGKSVGGISGGGCSSSENGSLNIPLLSGDIGLDQRPSTPIHSPTSSLFKISSPGLEGHWFNGDVSEFSLSNLLNHLESPVKVSTSLNSSGSHHHTEALETMNRLAPDMDSQLQCLISESSVDYIAKFEDLAAQISINDTPKKM